VCKSFKQRRTTHVSCCHLASQLAIRIQHYQPKTHCFCSCNLDIEPTTLTQIQTKAVLSVNDFESYLMANKDTVFSKLNWKLYRIQSGTKRWEAVVFLLWLCQILTDLKEEETSPTTIIQQHALHLRCVAALHWKVFENQRSWVHRYINGSLLSRQMLSKRPLYAADMLKDSNATYQYCAVNDAIQRQVTCAVQFVDDIQLWLINSLLDDTTCLTVDRLTV